MNRAWVRIAWRELAGGVRAFWVYLACLCLGAFAIAAAGTVTESFQRGLISEARMLLGGDVAFVAAQRRASPDERAFLDARGRVSETVTVRVMGQAGAVRTQVEARGVDDAFPLLGSVALSGGAATLAEALAFDGARWGVAVSPSLLEAFELEIGDRLTLGAIDVQVTARLDGAPDQLGTPGAFGPEALIRLDAFVEADRLTRGQLFQASYQMLLDGADPDEVERAADAAWGAGGLRFRGPEDAVDGLQEIFRMLEAFLAVVGVAALVAGGVGVAQATGAFLESRTGSIAALKALGADGGLIRSIYLGQLGALALVGAGAGVALGGAAPYAIGIVAGDRIPLPQVLGVYPGPMAEAFVLAALAAVVFAFPALGRARATPAAALFRATAAHGPARRPRLELSVAAAAALVLVAMAALTSPRPVTTLLLLAGAAAGYGALIGLAFGVRCGARALAGRASGATRLALSNLGGPGSLAPTVAPAMGLGLALLTLVVAVQANLLRQLQQTAPRNLPSLVFTQIPSEEADRFDALLGAHGVAVGEPEAYRRAPFILGRVSALNGQPVVEEAVAPSERWVIDGEMGLTYLAAQPPEAVLSEGAWWPPDYAGDVLVSVEAEAARGLGLGVGDTIGFQIFGRAVEAEIASLRLVDWGGFGVNSAFIFSPGALEAANPRHFAIARAPAGIEIDVIDAVGAAYPDVVVFQTREALQTAAKILADIAVAVNAAASVVIAAGLLVLFGAIGTISRKRRVESALLKTFGATRGEVLALYAGEFAAVGALAAVMGGALGLAAAYPTVVAVFEARWVTPWAVIGLVAGSAALVAAASGGLVGLAQVSRAPSRALRGA